MEKTLLSERNFELLRESQYRSTIEKDTIQRFIGFCEFNEEDVMLDTNCGRGDFLIASAGLIEHALGTISDKALYDLCLQNVNGKTNINLVNSKLDKLPFKRDMFTAVVNRFGLSRLENLSGTLAELVKYTGNQGRLCIQEFSPFDDEALNDFFNRFDYEVYHKQTPVIRVNTSMLTNLDMKIVKQETFEVETDFMWYIGQNIRSINNVERINQFIKEAFNHPVLSKYISFKNDVLFFRRKIISIMAQKN